MATTFGRRPNKVQDMQGRSGTDAAAWNTIREWTGPKADVTPAILRSYAEIATR